MSLVHIEKLDLPSVQVLLLENLHVHASKDQHVVIHLEVQVHIALDLQEVLQEAQVLHVVRLEALAPGALPVAPEVVLLVVQAEALRVAVADIEKFKPVIERLQSPVFF